MKKLLVIALSLTLFSCKDTYNRHICTYSKCPYKGITPNQWNEAVVLYTESEEGTDSWAVDMLHLEHPKWDYDTIDSVLFSPMKY